MCALKVDLMEDEEVVFEAERAVLTSQRLLANLDRKNPDTVTDAVTLRDVASFKKTNGGQDSRMRPGLTFGGAGLVLLLISFIQVVTGAIEVIIFTAGFLSFLLGVYFVLSSLVRIKPHTAVLFSVVGSRDIPVYFPGRDNPDADEMTRLFVRTKRGI